MSARFPGDGDVQSSVAVEIDHANLQANANRHIGLDVIPGELGRLRIPLVVVHADGIFASGIAAVVGPKTLAGDQLFFTVAIQVLCLSKELKENDLRTPKSQVYELCR